LPDGSTNLDNVFRFRNLIGSYAAVSAQNDTTWTYQQDWSTGVGDSTPNYFDHFDVVFNLATDGVQTAANIGTGTKLPGQTIPLGSGMKLDTSNNVVPQVAGPLYIDVPKSLNLQIASDFVVSGGVLTQNVVNLAKAINYNTTNFSTTGGALVINAVGVNQLIAGTALFLGTATFASIGGPEVQIGGAGITLADNYSSPQNTVTITSTGVTIAHGANSVQVTASGVAINNGSLALNLNGITTSITNQYVSVAGGTWYTGFQCKNNITNNWTGISELGLGAFTPSGGYAILFSNQLAIYNASGAIQGSHTATQITLGGQQVVGTRQTLTLSSGTDTATGWADSRAMADFNALLTALRNGHGLIT
jgi:hypothetical protein